MKTISVRDIRLHWPKAEQVLRLHGELVVTRDGTPVARLLPFEAAVPSPQQFEPAAHLRWLAGFWKGRAVKPSTNDWVAEDRDE